VEHDWYWYVSGGGAALLTIWRWLRLRHETLSLIRLLAVLGPSERIRRDAREVLRLSHPDAAHIQCDIPEPLAIELFVDQAGGSDEAARVENSAAPRELTQPKRA